MNTAIKLTAAQRIDVLDELRLTYGHSGDVDGLLNDVLAALRDFASPEARPLTASPTAQPSVEPVGEREAVLDGLYAAWNREPAGDTLAAIGNAIQHLQAARTTPPPAPVLLSDAEIQAIWSAKDTPLQQSKLSAFGMDRIRAIERAVLGRVGEKL